VLPLVLLPVRIAAQKHCRTLPLIWRPTERFERSLFLLFQVVVMTEFTSGSDRMKWRCGKFMAPSAASSIPI
jgi:hypothetical protein